MGVTSSHLRVSLARVKPPKARSTAAQSRVRLVDVSDRQVRAVFPDRLEDADIAALEAELLRILPAAPRRLELDLTQLTECSGAAVAAVAHCLSLAPHFTEGVGVRVATDAGRRALLGSMARA